jgi:tRNA(Ser,Leu) C12 N-acetylase TAN1
MTMTAGDSPTMLHWNVVLTCRPGGQRAVRRSLHPLARLRRSGFRNVLTGRVDDIDAFLSSVAELLERRRSLQSGLGKLHPVERTFAVDVATFHEQLATEAAVLVERMLGCSFHVRVERRGHKGVINTQDTEKALGDSLYAALEARGHTPVITFKDPDVVVAVEVIGDVAGLGLVTRELRQRFPFVRID